MKQGIVACSLSSAKLRGHGWPAARRGPAANLDRLGVSDTLVQIILWHSNVATTKAHYIKSAEQDVRDAMGRLETSLLDTNWTPTPSTAGPN